MTPDLQRNERLQFVLWVLAGALLFIVFAWTATLVVGRAVAEDGARLDPNGNAARATTVTISHYRPRVLAKRHGAQQRQFTVGPNTAVNH